MGIVYKAEDTRLKRPVALKFLPPELTRDPEAKARFIQEARAASALDHPNICTIHEIDETQEGQIFIVMACYEGESLKEKIGRGPLQIEEIPGIAIQIAEGLNRAHDYGIIHRDIKPANIMITERGEVKIIDFGLARLAGVSRITQIDTTAGTVAYMSPEQARGQEIDHRTDIWSLGVVFYEMLTGQLPFKGEYEQAIIYSILNEEPKPLTELRPDLPGEIQLIIDKILAKKPDERYQQVEVLVADLKEMKASDKLPREKTVKPKPAVSYKKRAYIYFPLIVLLLVIIGAVLHFSIKEEKGIDSIAVLPFQNADSNPEMEYLSDGITENIICKLSQLPHLKVISRYSAFQYKEKQVDITRVGKELNVRALIMGRVLQHGENLSISAELIDTEREYQIWGNQFNRKMADIFSVQEEISGVIVDNLKLELTIPERKELTRRYTDNVEAYNLYLKGRYFCNRETKDGLMKSIEYYQEALSRDSSFALAYAGLAKAYSYFALFGYLPTDEAYAKVKTAALKALAFDRTLSEAYTILGDIKFCYEWNFAEAEKMLQQAIEFNPNHAEAYWNYAVYLDAMGQFDKALIKMRKAKELNPLSLGISATLGALFYDLGDFRQAREQLLKTIEMDPNYGKAYWWLGWIDLIEGKYSEAIEVFQKFSDLQKEIRGDVLAAIGYVYAHRGNKAEARNYLIQLEELSRQRHVSPYWIALLYEGLGQKDQALEWLDKAYEARFPLMVFLKIEQQRFAGLRPDPRFTELLKKIGLEE